MDFAEICRKSIFSKKIFFRRENNSFLRIVRRIIEILFYQSTEDKKSWFLALRNHHCIICSLHEKRSWFKALLCHWLFVRFSNRTILFVFYFLFSFSLHSIIYILLFILYADFTLNFTLDFTLNFTFFASKPLFVGIPVGNGIGKNTGNDLGNFVLILCQI